MPRDRVCRSRAANRCIPFKSAFSQMYWVVSERATRSPAPPPKATRVADDQPSRSLLATHNDVQTGSCDWGREHAVYVGATRDELDVSMSTDAPGGSTSVVEPDCTSSSMVTSG